MSNTLWYNLDLVTPQGIVKDSSLLIGEDGRIAGIGVTPIEAGSSARLRDLRRLRVLPGLIDVHVHGGGGFEMMDAKYGDLDGMSRFHAANGTTAFLATTYTDSPERIEAALDNARSAMKTGVGGAELVGIHLEGPFLNALRAGAQNPADLTAPEPALVERYLAAADGCIRLVTIAPELPGGMAAVRRFVEAGITVSAGHTDATFAQMQEAVRHGLAHTTHHYNGMRPLHHREPGVIGAGLLLPELTIELIADGIHSHPEMIRMAYLLKPADRICAITDAILCAGLPDGTYGDVVMTDGEVYLLDGSSLAGSSLTMIRALRNTLKFTGLGLTDILPAFTSVPARQSGVGDRKGTIEVGKDADFIAVDGEIELQLTVVRGREVYGRDAG